MQVILLKRGQKFFFTKGSCRGSKNAEFYADLKNIKTEKDFTKYAGKILAEDVVDEAQDTSMILSTYIKGLTLPVNNDKMITFMNDIYKEALSTEHLT